MHLFPGRILRCCLVLRLYYKAFAETKSCLLVKPDLEMEMNLVVTTTNDTNEQFAARIGLDWAESKTLLEHVHQRRKAAARRNR